MVNIYIGVGSNVDAEANIRSGLLALQERLGALRLSRVYESEAVGFVGDNFLNLVVAAQVDLPVSAVSAMLRDIEDNHRRNRATPKFSPRTLDLDLLLYGNAIYAQDGLSLPRDEITKNAFVLAPLAELAAEEVHPLLQKNYQTLWHEYDKAKQRLWPIEFPFPSAV